jgi:phosphopantothenate synthetase
MNREQTIKQLDEMVRAYTAMAKLTKSMSNSPDEVMKKITLAYEAQDYIKEFLK